MPIQAINDQTPSQFPCGDAGVARINVPQCSAVRPTWLKPTWSFVYSRRPARDLAISNTTTLNTTTDIPPVTERSSIQRHPAPTIAATDQCVCPLYCNSVTHLPITQIGVSPWSKCPQSSNLAYASRLPDGKTPTARIRGYAHFPKGHLVLRL